jgi:hypothetical protein
LCPLFQIWNHPKHEPGFNISPSISWCLNVVKGCNNE